MNDTDATPAALKFSVINRECINRFHAANFLSPNRHLFVAGLKLCDDFARAMLSA